MNEAREGSVPLFCCDPETCTVCGILQRHTTIPSVVAYNVNSPRRNHPVRASLFVKYIGRTGVVSFISANYESCPCLSAFARTCPVCFCCIIQLAFFIVNWWDFFAFFRPKRLWISSGGGKRCCSQLVGNRVFPIRNTWRCIADYSSQPNGRLFCFIDPLWFFSD